MVVHAIPEDYKILALFMLTGAYPGEGWGVRPPVEKKNCCNTFRKVATLGV